MNRAFILSLRRTLSIGPILASCRADTPEQPTPTPPPPTATIELVETPVIGDILAGQHLFAEVCAPCHGQTATGIDGIGLDLTTSQFVGALTTAQLAGFTAMGRGVNSPFNLTGIVMPAKGGRLDLNSEDMLNIAAYLRSLNTQPDDKSDRAADYLSWLESGGVEETETVEEVSPEVLSGAAIKGQTMYLRFCAVCHAPQGEGVEGLGYSLIGSELVTGLDDDNLAQLIRQGRPADDPLNSAGIEMLPYGGQTPFADDELNNLIAYLRAIGDPEATLAAKPSDVAEIETVVETQETLSDEEFQALKDEAFSIMLRARPKCFTCHYIIERGNKNGPGPHLSTVGLVAAGRVPGLSDREYIKQSIVDPTAFTVAECPSGPCVGAMPGYGEQLKEEKLETLVNFFLSLK